MTKRIVSNVLLFLSVILLAAACKDDDNPAPVSNDPNVVINNWIYDVMDEVYYWTSTLPDQEDINDKLDPLDYFEALRYSGDRFSFIVDDYQDLINLLEGVSMEAGYEFTLFQEGASNVIAVIRYVKNNSPAKEAGLRRGDVIYAINGETMNFGNYQSVLSGIGSNHSVSYRAFSENSQSYVDKGEVSLETVVLAENPNLLDTVYTINNHKIGYYFYNFFSPGQGSGVEYDQEMDEIFTKFQSEGITDLIVDLRYNSGGSIASATNLASLIAPNVSASDIFYENRWNALYTTHIESLENGDDILRGKFRVKAANIGNKLNGQTVYILVGNRTASASELIINGLDPYMNVEIVGDTTVGKNVGSIQIYEEDDPDNSYGMLPIVLKTYNSLGQSNYDKGFFPTGSNLINENYYLWFPVGDIRDPLLNQAIEDITGSIQGRIADPLEDDQFRRTPVAQKPERELPMIFEMPENFNLRKP